MSPQTDPDRWWQGGVFYQIYPRSYADTNGDGVGDLPGVISKLDHLARLGIDGVWLSPLTCSPNRDWGYDVSNYRDIDPSFGTLDDLDTLVHEAGARGIRILMDLVPNHTSDQHAWFVDALRGRDATYRDYYVWADPKPDGSPPNNWVSIFGGPAWEFDEPSGQYYLHNFEAGQPDLNWWSDEVRREFEEIVQFWWDRGVAGFRIDVCNMMIKDKELRDNPPATKDDPIEQQFMGVRYVYNTDRPEAHDILRRWRTIADSYEPGRLLIGETNVETLERLVQFYGSGRNELHGGFNFTFMQAPFEAAALRAVVEGTEALLPAGAWPTWHGSNHDFSRLSTRWAGGDPDKVKVAVLVLLTLRGTPFLYQGDEIGLVDGDVPKEEMLDPVGIRFSPYAGRDPVRTPMPWHGGPGGGFSEPGVRPWLPMTDPAACNVADQEGDADSVLEFCRRVIAARRASDDLAVGEYRSLPSAEHSWAYARGEGTTVVLNMSDASVTFKDVPGVITVSTDAALEGSSVEGGLTLPAWSGAVIAMTAGPVQRRRYVLCTTPAQGHTAPLLALARRLVAEDHAVTFFTTAHYREQVEATGASFVPFAPEDDAHDLMVVNPERESSSRRGVRGVKDDLRRIFVGPLAGQCRGLRAILADFPADCIVVDSMFFGALPLALGPATARPALACVGVMPLASASRDTAPFGSAFQPGAGPLHRVRNRSLNWLTEHVVLADIQRLARRRLVEAGAPGFAGSLIDLQPKVVDAYLQATVEGFEYPRSDLASSVRFVGPILAPPAASFEPPPWWDELAAARPVVHVTQGTLDNADLERLLLLSARALAHEDMLVVATTGGPDPAPLRRGLPANMRLERFIPHDVLLPHVDAMVTNGGYGGVQQALAHGVPLVVAGDSEDKPEVAARVQWSGTGVNLHTGRPSQAMVARGVRRVLRRDTYRRRAQALQAEIQASDPLGTITSALEDLCEERARGARAQPAASAGS